MRFNVEYSWIPPKRFGRPRATARSRSRFSPSHAIQLWSRRHPDAGADHRIPTRLEVEIKAGASRLGLSPDVPGGAAMMEPAGRVGLVR